MGFASLETWMDPSEWLQGSMSDDGGMGDSSSPSSLAMLACSRPVMERRLRPPHDQALKCPRCESTNTKFCYYNNYSLTQPRYFCKTCRRYWTKGGTLRNIPVGGGCRKNKRSSSSSSSSSKKTGSVDQQNSESSIGHGQQFGALVPNATDLQLSFPQVQLSHHLTSLFGSHETGLGTSFLDNKYNGLLDRAPNFDFLGNKFDALATHNVTRGHDLLGSTNIGINFGIGPDHHLGGHNYHGGLLATSNNFFTNNMSSSSSPYGLMSAEGSSSSHTFDNPCQRLMLPYDYHQVDSSEHGHQTSLMDVKPSTKLLSLEWQANSNGGTANDNKNSFDYTNSGGVNGLGSWSGTMLNGYTPSTTNSLL